MSHILQSVSVVIPIIFVLCLGFFAQRSKVFGTNEDVVTLFNEFTLKFSLPALLFVGTVSMSKSELLKDLDLFLVFLVSLLSGYIIGFLIAKVVFKRSVIESAIAGLVAAFPSGPFYGTSLLNSIYGTESEAAISIIAISLNVFIMPLVTVIINVSSSQQSTQHDSLIVLVGKSVYEAIFKTPFVLASLVGFIFVFIDIKMPSVVINSLDLIGNAASSMAVFVAGMTIAERTIKMSVEVGVDLFLKCIVIPVLFVGVAFLFKMPLYSPIFNQGLLLAALPAGPMVILLSTKYKAYQEEASSAFAFSPIVMVIALTALITMINP